MGRFDNILMTADFDRTFTDENTEMPPANFEAVREFEEEGGLFTINTGRSVPMFRKFMYKIPTSAPLILYNGAGTYDKERKELLSFVEMPGGRELVREIHDRYPDLWLEVQGGEYHYFFEEDKQRARFMHRFEADYKIVSIEEVPLPILNYTLSGRYYDDSVGQFYKGTEDEFRYMDKVQAELERDYGEMILINRSMPRMMDMMNKRVSKGRAARELAQKLGRGVLVCAGDAPNDLSMLEEADIAFIPADCSPEIKGRGFRETLPCAQGTIRGAVDELKKLF